MTYLVPPDATPCQAPDAPSFFPSSREGADLAIALCKQCPFIEECRKQQAGAEYGVWAGVWYTGITGAEALRREIRELRERDPDITGHRIEKTLGVGRSSVQWALRQIAKEDAAA